MQGSKKAGDFVSPAFIWRIQDVSNGGQYPVTVFRITMTVYPNSVTP